MRSLAFLIAQSLYLKIDSWITDDTLQTLSVMSGIQEIGDKCLNMTLDRRFNYLTVLMAMYLKLMLWLLFDFSLTFEYCPGLLGSWKAKLLARVYVVLEFQRINRTVFCGFLQPWHGRHRSVQKAGVSR